MSRSDPLKIYGIIAVVVMLLSAVVRALGETAIGEWLFWASLGLTMSAAIAHKYRNRLPPKEYQPPINLVDDIDESEDQERAEHRPRRDR